MSISSYHPRCSIPYIDLEKEPERELENEQNKEQNGWQPGDGYVSEKSGFGVIHTFNETIDNYKKCREPNPELKERLAEASPYGSLLNGLCFAASCWDPNYCELIVQSGGKQLLEIGSGEDGDTPLICAIKSGAAVHESFNNCMIGKTITLLELGANPNMANTFGRTPLWYAAEVNKNLTVIGLLLLKRAIMNPMPSIEGKQRIKQAKMELISQGKAFDLIDEIQELFKAKYETKFDHESFNDIEINLIKYLPEDVFYEIVSKITEVFKNDECLPKAFKNDPILETEACSATPCLDAKSPRRRCIII